MGEIDGAFRAWGFAKNGSGGVSGSIYNAAIALGVEIRVNAGVKQVIVKNERAWGVALENGDELHAKVVMSAADPKRTFLQFVEEKYFPDEFVTSIQNFRTRGSSGKVNIALSELPNFTALPFQGKGMTSSCIGAPCPSARASITSSAPTTMPSTGRSPNARIST